MLLSESKEGAWILRLRMRGAAHMSIIRIVAVVACAISLYCVQRSSFDALVVGNCGEYGMLFGGLALGLWLYVRVAMRHLEGWRRHLACGIIMVVCVGDTPCAGIGVLSCLPFLLHVLWGCISDRAFTVAFLTGPFLREVYWWIVMLPRTMVLPLLLGVSMSVAIGLAERRRGRGGPNGETSDEPGSRRNE